jgi:hypothetical protein
LIIALDLVWPMLLAKKKRQTGRKKYPLFALLCLLIFQRSNTWRRAE